MFENILVLHESKIIVHMCDFRVFAPNLPDPVPSSLSRSLCRKGSGVKDLAQICYDIYTGFIPIVMCCIFSWCNCTSQTDQTGWSRWWGSNLSSDPCVSCLRALGVCTCVILWIAVLCDLVKVKIEYSLDQRSAIKFCVKLKKTLLETFQMLQQIFGDDRLSRFQSNRWHEMPSGVPGGCHRRSSRLCFCSSIKPLSTSFAQTAYEKVLRHNPMKTWFRYV